ncbi:hypothetical protein AB6A40_005493 [Gnathostoma spinigerum]|uniref:Saposin B-type domain-containing protein n=1 Tax=Gnathostoma spinigerum TaxID=75299 RepID=A0ABD6EN87_9BILA
MFIQAFIILTSVTTVQLIQTVKNEGLVTCEECRAVAATLVRRVVGRSDFGTKSLAKVCEENVHEELSPSDPTCPDLADAAAEIFGLTMLRINMDWTICKRMNLCA